MIIYGESTIPGQDIHGQVRVNEDAIYKESTFYSNEDGNFSLLMMCDGHGPYGCHVANFTVKYYP